MSSPKMIVLKSNDNETFEVEEAVALMSQTIKHMIEDDCANAVIPVANVDGEILAKVIEYCKKHVVIVDEKSADDQLLDNDAKDFDKEFVKDIGDRLLFELILAANYLDIKSLLDITCQTVADRIKDKTPEEVRECFNIENDFTPEEEKAVREENKWAFE